MARARSSSSSKQAQAQAKHQPQNGGGHALLSKLARYLDPEASWDKVRAAAAAAAAVPLLASFLAAVHPVADAPDFGSSPLRQDQLLDAVHWIRQAVGLLCGLLWGAVPLVGAVWIALFLAISTGIIYWYYAYLLKIDEEEYGGHGPLLQEGLFASFTLFLVTFVDPSVQFGSLLRSALVKDTIGRLCVMSGRRDSSEQV
ncbi:hypothetical protein ACP4OV_015943 [Aristida adscensionis]